MKQNHSLLNQSLSDHLHWVTCVHYDMLCYPYFKMLQKLWQSVYFNCGYQRSLSLTRLLNNCHRPSGLSCEKYKGRRADWPVNPSLPPSCIGWRQWRLVRRAARRSQLPLPPSSRHLAHRIHYREETRVLTCDMLNSSVSPTIAQVCACRQANNTPARPTKSLKKIKKKLCQH